MSIIEAQEPMQQKLVAYEINAPAFGSLVAAPIPREWMDRSPNRSAYRCLPLTIANQSGWVVRSPSSFSVQWNGGDLRQDTIVVSDESPPDPMVSSLFGLGTLTFNMPWLFRTPPGVNLWVKGPANMPKDGVCPLEGVVETDWSSTTFTMNWKITRANFLVRFERGEPICMIVPVPRGLAESLIPTIKPIASNPAVQEAFLTWSQARNNFIERVANQDPEAIRAQWQKDYFQGRDSGTESFEGHQTKLTLKEFIKEV